MILEKRLTKIGDIELQNPLHIKEFYNPKNILEKNYIGIDGGLISYQKRLKAESRTAYSFESGWLNYQEKEAILNLYNNLGFELTLTYSDNTTERVRFNHSKGISFAPLFEGSEYYKATINFIKIPN